MNRNRCDLPQEYYDREYIHYCMGKVKRKVELSEGDILSLYNIFIKSFRIEAYVIQEIRAIQQGRRINRADCE